MPLLSGKGPRVRSENIRTLRHEGYPEDQSIAIAYSKEREQNKKKRKKRSTGMK